MASRDSLSPSIQRVLTRFSELVRGVGYRHGLSEDEVDELMQSVRLRLWHARSSSEQIEATPASYMYRTAVSAALDVIRSRRDRANEQIDTTRESGEMRLGSLPGPDVELEHSELGAVVSRAVEEVTPSRRPVLRMYLAGYDREEIAALLGWSEAKTRNLLYRGLADLRALLSGRGIGPEVTR